MGKNDWPNDDSVSIDDAAGDFNYLTWYGTQSAHITADKRKTLCGLVNTTPFGTMLTPTPFGKPVCSACHKALNPDSSSEEEKEDSSPSTEETTDNSLSQSVPRVVPPLELKMPPPEFFQRGPL